MQTSKAKENILKKIRQALVSPVPVPFQDNEQKGSVYHPIAKELEVDFAENFTALAGIFSYCVNENELTAQLSILKEKKQWSKIYCAERSLKNTLSENHFNTNWYEELSSCNVSITSCELLIARTGSIVLSSAQPNGRTASVYAPAHICIAYTNQLVYDIEEGLQMLQEKYKDNLPSLISFATGPSRTADIEKTLVVGVHGPKEVYVFLVDSQ